MMTTMMMMIQQAGASHADADLPEESSKYLPDVQKTRAL